MEHILGPAVFQPGQGPVEVLHGSRHADPVVGFQLGQGDDQVCLHDAAGKIKAVQRAGLTPVGNKHRRFVIQIRKFQMLAFQGIPHARFDQGQLGIADVTRRFAHGHLGPPAAEDFRRGQDHRRMGGHVRQAAVRFDQIRFQKDPPAPYRGRLHPAGPQAVADRRHQPAVVPLTGRDEDRCGGRGGAAEEGIAGQGGQRDGTSGEEGPPIALRGATRVSSSIGAHVLVLPEGMLTKGFASPARARLASARG